MGLIGGDSETEKETWCVDGSDDEKYDPTKSGKGVWEPTPKDILQLFEKIEKEKVLELNWKCPGRRPPKGTEEEDMDATQDPSIEAEPEEAEEEPKPQQPTEFDFEEDEFDTATKVTPRRTPGVKTPKSQKKVARMDKVLQDMMMQRIQNAAEKQARRQGRSPGSTPSGRVRMGMSPGSGGHRSPGSSPASSPAPVRPGSSPGLRPTRPAMNMPTRPPMDAGSTTPVRSMPSSDISQAAQSWSTSNTNVNATPPAMARPNKDSGNPPVGIPHGANLQTSYGSAMSSVMAPLPSENVPASHALTATPTGQRAVTDTVMSGARDPPPLPPPPPPDGGGM
ncbi:PAXIP1-associated glutamate-rich protein 1-like [Pecten maximus]|uniref:PAXIP1-associated glutamate-rich protein 1-like n=1 Tax=Pecten maximus TaxID=6579 RepID=UPI001458A748|nr:PAXIP1-associated glutamate-rich protein 1-like [Pecten maximus]XP_033748802.1 PAXIP1-associated glutamate-rich protein 1-like [Pecten maximus]XP_033748803.1 PAXIP1-associated glutamate-rich protein 1-like [Pecten maximus]